MFLRTQWEHCTELHWKDIRWQQNSITERITKTSSHNKPVMKSSWAQAKLRLCNKVLGTGAWQPFSFVFIIPLCHQLLRVNSLFHCRLRIYRCSIIRGLQGGESGWFWGMAKHYGFLRILQLPPRLCHLTGLSSLCMDRLLRVLGYH